ncbi:hypothetical protein CPC08DRAFT_561180 [Agrocybe pediades]|nr:hypothetical protein CPC08DRAFT_561180 [Agrocybe pediades]
MEVQGHVSLFGVEAWSPSPDTAPNNCFPDVFSAFLPCSLLPYVDLVLFPVFKWIFDYTHGLKQHLTKRLLETGELQAIITRGCLITLKTRSNNQSNGELPRSILSLPLEHRSWKNLYRGSGGRHGKVYFILPMCRVLWEIVSGCILPYVAAQRNGGEPGIYPSKKQS